MQVLQTKGSRGKVEQSKQARPVGKPRIQILIVAHQPTIKGAIANPFEGKQDGIVTTSLGYRLAYESREKQIPCVTLNSEEKFLTFAIMNKESM